MSPDSPNVIQVPQVDDWQELACRKDSFLPGSHVDVGIGRSKALAHRGALDLEVKPVLEDEVIACQADVKET